MKVYLAGPMRGYENYNFPAFMAGAAFLRNEGHEVFNPAENDIAKGYVTITADGTVSDGESNMRDCIMDDLTYIARQAEAIALLPGWEDSSGCRAEIALAQFLSIDIFQLVPKQEEEKAETAA